MRRMQGARDARQRMEGSVLIPVTGTGQKQNPCCRCRLQADLRGKYAFNRAMLLSSLRIAVCLSYFTIDRQTFSSDGQVGDAYNL
jgi:hypothetical protein